VNSPVGLNQLSLDYATARANASIDASLVIAGAKLNLNAGTFDYTRAISFLHRFAWVEASVPVGRLNGQVSGTRIQGAVNGTGDSSYEFGTILKGAPALGVPEFSAYEPKTSIGMSLTVSAPTGSYNADRILNLGSGRWSFKPEAAVSHPFGRDDKWEVDCYANAYFFTDNTHYRGREILRQEPIPGFEGHLSYAFSSNIWASLDSRYSLRGNTLVDDVSQDNSQQNVVIGSEVSVSLSARHSLLFRFAKAIYYRNAPNSTAFSVKYIYTWGSNYK
jgi:hypothetical protein